ncbi:MAG: GerAB/ArcD/ProY family transporter [Firmicutes bacterium]|nr:GerAB/ArcD/ProY family transporter [Bacillota bacterium]
MLVVQLVYEMIFQLPVAEENVLPVYQLARIIRYGRFFQRLETIFVFFWLLNGLVALSAAFYGATTGLAKGLSLPDYRPILLATALVAYALAFIPPNYPTTMIWDRQFLQNLGWIITFVLPGLLFLVTLIRRKGGQSGASMDGHQPPGDSA